MFVVRWSALIVYNSKVLVSSEVTGLSTLGQMARDSLEVHLNICYFFLVPYTVIFLKHSTLDDVEKKCAIALWEKQWAKFINELNSNAT